MERMFVCSFARSLVCRSEQAEQFALEIVEHGVAVELGDVVLECHRHSSSPVRSSQELPVITGMDVDQTATCGTGGVEESEGASTGVSASLTVSWTPSPRQSGHELRPVVNHYGVLVCASLDTREALLT